MREALEVLGVEIDSPICCQLNARTTIHYSFLEYRIIGLPYMLPICL